MVAKRHVWYSQRNHVGPRHPREERSLLRVVRVTRVSRTTTITVQTTFVPPALSTPFHPFFQRCCDSRAPSQRPRTLPPRRANLVLGAKRYSAASSPEGRREDSCVVARTSERMERKQRGEKRRNSRRPYATRQSGGRAADRSLFVDARPGSMLGCCPRSAFT